MSRILFGYGYMRNSALKHRKIFGVVLCLLFGAFLYRTHTTEGRAGKLFAMKMDYDVTQGIDLDLVPNNLDREELEHLAIGEARRARMDNERAVETIIEVEEDLLDEVRAEINGSLLSRKPVYDTNGNEIGLRFLILSDWGYGSNQPSPSKLLRNIGSGMANLSSQYDCSFILTLGDHFSDRGVKTVDDRHFKIAYEDVFNQQSLHKPWYAVAGDLDYKGSVRTQIKYSDLSRRWSFKSKYYKWSARLPTFQNVTVDFVMIDTVQLCGRVPPSGLKQPRGPDNKTAADEQWWWIEQTLNSSRAQYLIAAGHYPVYSGGRHGSTNCLVERLVPLLQKYHVTAYFSGHDHSVQHIKSSGKGGVHYFVTGAASGMPDRPDNFDKIYKSVRYFWTNNINNSTGAFTYCDVRKNYMTVAFVYSDKTVLYLTKLLPRYHNTNQAPQEDVAFSQARPKVPTKSIKAPIHQNPPNRNHDIYFDHHRLRPKSFQQLQQEQQQLALRKVRTMMNKYKRP
ncbi:unnamed protein product [Clavelina lepadiformis]|uniref:Tartrate-resistant acid phosphatase type 5 n=1 Tax=Clavelina lepadiformis TaxID=159417 RepID=A0ABP0GAX0_CLALP